MTAYSIYKTKMRDKMARESSWKKLCVVLSSLVYLTVVTTVATSLLYSWLNVQSIQDASEIICGSEEVKEAAQQPDEAICREDIVVYDMYYLI